MQSKAAMEVTRLVARDLNGPFPIFVLYGRKRVLVLVLWYDKSFQITINLGRTVGHGGNHPEMYGPKSDIAIQCRIVKENIEGMFER